MKVTRSMPGSKPVNNTNYLFQRECNSFFLFYIGNSHSNLTFSEKKLIFNLFSIWIKIFFIKQTWRSSWTFPLYSKVEKLKKLFELFNAIKRWTDKEPHVYLRKERATIISYHNFWKSFSITYVRLLKHEGKSGNDKKKSNALCRMRCGERFYGFKIQISMEMWF